jgi:hypothetical protein
MKRCGAGVFVFALCSTTAQAGCIEALGTSSIDICLESHCETAAFSKMCGNIHNSSQSFISRSSRWIFVVRTPEGDSKTPEYAILRDEITIAGGELLSMTCTAENGHAYLCEDIFAKAVNAVAHPN